MRDINLSSLKKLGLLFFIPVIIAFGGLYSYKFFSFLMPSLTVFLIWAQGGLKKESFQLSPPFVFLFLLLVLAGLSLIWSNIYSSNVHIFFSLCFTFIFSFLLISCLKNAKVDLVFKAYKTTMISGLFLIILVVIQAYIDTFEINSLQKYAGVAYLMKPTGSILGLLAFVSCGFLWINDHKFLSLLTFFLLILMILLTSCQTAFFGMLLGTGVFILSYLMPFWMTRFSLVATSLYLVLSPVLYAYCFVPSRMLGSPYFERIVNESLYYRFLAWEFYSEKFFERPFLGWGLDSSRYFLEKPTLHPHNNSIQTYVELGLLGGLLYSLFFASLFWFVEKKVKDRLSVAVCNATLIFGFIAAEVTHSVWRNYWLSLVALTAGLVILFLKARENQVFS